MPELLEQERVCEEHGEEEEEEHDFDVVIEIDTSEYEEEVSQELMAGLGAPLKDRIFSAGVGPDSVGACCRTGAAFHCATILIPHFFLHPASGVRSGQQQLARAIVPNKTRWNTGLACLVRLQRLYPYILRTLEAAECYAIDLRLGESVAWHYGFNAQSNKCSAL
jgi:hypothetical protein